MGGAQRTALEGQAVRELAALCAGLPLALRIAAAQLMDRPHESIHGYVSRQRAVGRVNGLALRDEATMFLTIGENGLPQRPSPLTHNGHNVRGALVAPTGMP